AAALVRGSRSGVGGAEPNGAGTPGKGAEAEESEGADLIGRLAGGAAAHAGRRLPQRDAFPQTRRPGSEAGRRRPRLPASADERSGAGEALASPCSAGSAHV